MYWNSFPEDWVSLQQLIGQGLPEQEMMLSVGRTFHIPCLSLKLESFYFHYNGKKFWGLKEEEISKIRFEQGWGFHIWEMLASILHIWQPDSKLNLRSIYNVLVFHEYLFTGVKLSSSSCTTVVIFVKESCLNFPLHCKHKCLSLQGKRT